MGGQKQVLPFFKYLHVISYGHRTCSPEMLTACLLMFVGLQPVQRDFVLDLPCAYVLDWNWSTLSVLITLMDDSPGGWLLPFFIGLPSQGRTCLLAMCCEHVICIQHISNLSWQEIKVLMQWFLRTWGFLFKGMLSLWWVQRHLDLCWLSKTWQCKWALARVGDGISKATRLWEISEDSLMHTEMLRLHN